MPTKFFLHENGITCMCPGTRPGEKGKINGIVYESVDNELLRKRRDEGADMSKLCTSLVTDMSDLFRDEFNFNQPLGSWDVSNVTDMSRMFWGCRFNRSISKWDVGKVKSMRYMFRDSPFNQALEDWNVSNVTDMTAMFTQTQFNQPIGNWDVKNVTDMLGMFRNSKFNQNISKWCVRYIPSEPLAFSSDSPLTEENKPKWGTCPE